MIRQVRRMIFVIEGSSTRVPFDYPVPGSYGFAERGVKMTVRSATILWSYKNVAQDHAGAWLTGGDSVNLDGGFHTVSDITTSLDTIGVALTANRATGKCTIVGSDTADLNLSDEVKRILGFTTNASPIARSSTAVGNDLADVTLGLGYLKVKCGLCYGDGNRVNGVASEVLVMLPLPDTSRLFGSVQRLEGLDSSVPIGVGPVKNIVIEVTNKDDKPVDVGTIILECYLC